MLAGRGDAGTITSGIRQVFDGLMEGKEWGEQGGETGVTYLESDVRDTDASQAAQDWALRTVLERLSTDEIRDAGPQDPDSLRRAVSRMRAVGRAHGCSELEIQVATAQCLHLIDAGKRILTIAAASVRRGATLRWFDARRYYERQGAASGGDPDLVPLNSVERLPSLTGLLGFADRVSLTIVNRHSLTFWAPETERTPGCLFSADGLLDGDRLAPVPEKCVAVTTPHHGSASNRAAYPNLDLVLGGDWKRRAVLLRSDRSVKKNPCADFRSTAQRLCTVCPNNGLGYQKLTLRVEPCERAVGFCCCAPGAQVRLCLKADHHAGYSAAVQCSPDRQPDRLFRGGHCQPSLAGGRTKMCATGARCWVNIQYNSYSSDRGMSCAGRRTS